MQCFFSCDSALFAVVNSTELTIFTSLGNKQLLTVQGVFPKRPVLSWSADSYLAISSSKNSITVYDGNNGRFVSELRHLTEKVISIAWLNTENQLVTATKSGKITQWKIKQPTIKEKAHWQTDLELSKISTFGNDHYLVAAGRTISIWSVDEQSCLWSFVGHATPVSCLCPVRPDNNNLANGSSANAQPPPTVFLSSSAGEGTVSIWRNGNTASPQTASLPVGQLSVEAEVHSIGCCHLNGCLLLAVLTSCGRVLLYRHPGFVNGNTTKPVRSFVSLSIQTEDQNRLPIRAVSICLSDGHCSCRLVYGGPLRFLVETVEIDGKLAGHSTIVRHDPNLFQISQPVGGLVTKTPKMDSAEVATASKINLESDRSWSNKRSVELIVDGTNETSPYAELKRKRLSSLSGNTDQLMADRLATKVAENNDPTELVESLTTGPAATASTVPAPTTAATTTTTTTAATTHDDRQSPEKLAERSRNLAQLTVKALKSTDSKLLAEVLSEAEVNLIRQAVQLIPSRFVSRLIEALLAGIAEQPCKTAELNRWIQAVLIEHCSFVQSNRKLLGRLSQSLSLFSVKHGRQQRLLATIDFLLSAAAKKTNLPAVGRPLDDYLNFEDEASSDSELSDADEMHDFDCLDDDNPAFQDDDEDVGSTANSEDMSAGSSLGDDDDDDDDDDQDDDDDDGGGGGDDNDGGDETAGNDGDGDETVDADLGGGSDENAEDDDDDDGDNDDDDDDDDDVV